MKYSVGCGVAFHLVGGGREGGGIDYNEGVARATIIQRRRVAHAWLIGALLIVVAMAATLELTAGRGPRTARTAFEAAAVVLILVVMAVREIRAGRRMAMLVRSDWRRCLYCFFDLHGLKYQGTCPECGEAYDAERVRRVWRDGMRPETKGRAEGIAEAD